MSVLSDTIQAEGQLYKFGVWNDSKGYVLDRQVSPEHDLISMVHVNLVFRSVYKYYTQ